MREPDVVAPLVYVLEKLCNRFPKFEAALTKIMTPAKNGTNSTGPK